MITAIQLDQMETELRQGVKLDNRHCYLAINDHDGFAWISRQPSLVAAYNVLGNFCREQLAVLGYERDEPMEDMSDEFAIEEYFEHYGNSYIMTREIVFEWHGDDATIGEQVRSHYAELSV
jgi:hypothetical protein